MPEPSLPEQKPFLTDLQSVFEQQARRLRRLQIVFFLLLALLGVLTFFLDQSLIQWIAEHRTRDLKNFARGLSEYGDWPWLMAAAIPFLIYGCRKKRTALFRLVATMMIASSVAGLTVDVVRGTTGRARPSNTLVAPGWYGLRHEGKWLIGVHKFNSFPSGHSGAAFGFFSVLVLQGRRASWLWILPPLLVAGSRMMLNVHHLSDVFYGAWIGFGVAWWAGYWNWIKTMSRRATSS